MTFETMERLNGERSGRRSSKERLNACFALFESSLALMSPERKTAWIEAQKSKRAMRVDAQGRSVYRNVPADLLKHGR